MNKKQKAIAEKLGWHVHEENGEYIDFAQYSPAGEDFSFTVSAKNCIQEVIEYAENFDADEHAEMWVKNMHETEGVPQSIRVLIDDAESIQEMLDNLAEALSKTIKKTRK